MIVYELPKAEALEKMKDEPYKVELINELPDGEKISFYDNGSFVDMCRGPHVLNLKDIADNPCRHYPNLLLLHIHFYLLPSLIATNVYHIF